MNDRPAPAPAPDGSNRWHPVAAEDDVADRHVFQGLLLGRELAIWRADDGYVNVWENRCLHRGVRLTIGVNEGTELVCRYHGWRYANRSAGCTYIPAHPVDAPAQTITNRTFPSQVRYGLIWSGDSPDVDPPTVDLLEVGTPFGLRNLPVRAPQALVVEHLASHRFLPADALDADPTTATMTAVAAADHIAVTSSVAGSTSTVVFFVQPTDAHRSVIRPVATDTPDDELAMLRHHSVALARLVRAIELDAASQPMPEPLAPGLAEAPVLLPAPRSPAGRDAPLRVEVRRKWMTAQDTVAFELSPLTGTLPTFQPGAHLDVHLPGGHVRQYSITNGPGITDHYRIAVKLEPDSAGGSRTLHEVIDEGDVLAVSHPRNNFPLRRDARRTVLIAGGIGITPIAAMAQALASMDLDFELHVFARSEAHVALREILDSLDPSVHRHLGLSPEDTVGKLADILDEPADADHVYACGPGPMLDAVRETAAIAGWSDDAVHFEYFANPIEIDASSTFRIALAKSAVTYEVPGGSSILDVLRANGVPMPSSCEQGACGTCAATVLDGVPDHQDVHLNATERRSGTTIMTCVSRSKSDELVLDL